MTEKRVTLRHQIISSKKGGSRSRVLPSGNSPGRPRSSSVRKAILKATNDLLDEDGFANLTIEGIAARAGTGKSTIYRWWKSKGALAIEAFLEELAPIIAFPHTSKAMADLRSQMHSVAQAYREKPGKVVREMIALGQSDPETKNLFIEGYLMPRRNLAKEVLQRAIDQGELKSRIDLEIIVDMLYGPIFHRMLTGHAPIDDNYVNSIISSLLEGIATGNIPQTQIR
ncbi:MAG: TetR/AcrR family transcriptional regulator [Betaproteobacteria bacterium]|nr:TetR/AcrR family transcriptional regulator [Betaproteobacteria bacterium]